MQDYASALAKAVQKGRTESEITQEALATAADTNPRTILDIENGRGNPRLDTLYNVVRALNLNANDIFYPEKSGDDTLQQLKRELTQCSEYESEMLLGICRSVLATMRSKTHITIE